jgi:hypothetical protein
MVFALQGHFLCIFVFGNRGVGFIVWKSAFRDMSSTHRYIGLIFAVLVYSHVWFRIEMVVWKSAFADTACTVHTHELDF